MPLAPMNFQPSGDPIAEGLIPAIQRGMQLYYGPKQAQQQMQTNDLNNALLQIKQQYQPQLDQADIASKNAYAKNAPLQTQMQQAQLAALLQKLSGPSAFQQKQELANQQAALKSKQAQDAEWGKVFSDAQKDFSNYKTLNDYATNFSSAYDQSTYTGKRLGSIPSRGIFSAGGAPEQEADIASQNMAATMLALSKGRFTNYGLKFIQSLKPDRSLVPEAKQSQVDSINSQYQRMGELQPFLNKAKASGYTPSQAQQLWNQYQDNFPATTVQDPATGKSFVNNLGKWQAMLQGGMGNGSANSSSPANPSPQQMPQFQSGGSMPLQADQILKMRGQPGVKDSGATFNAPSGNQQRSPINEQTIAQTAQKYGISIERTKQLLRQKGLLQ